MHSPLAYPEHPDLLLHFCRRFDIPSALAPPQRLDAVVRAFSRLPYENLTKIVKYAQDPGRDRARRWPREVLDEFHTSGAGGTCFSLTAALLHLVRSLGWQSEPILADRRYGSNTHSALVIWIDGKLHLLDPGYLILQPVPLPVDRVCQVRTAFNQIVLTPRGGGRLVDLATRTPQSEVYRLTYKTTPVSASEFLRAWDASFGWDMMHYPLVSSVAADHQLYLRGARLQVRSATDVQRSEIATENLAEQIVRRFGISPRVVTRALRILQQQRDRIGSGR